MSSNIDNNDIWESIESEGYMLFKVSISRLKYLWETIGLSREEISVRAGDIVEQYRKLNAEVLSEASNHYSNLKPFVEELEKIAKKLYSELDMPCAEKENTLTLLEERKQLEKQIEYLSQIKENRIAEYKTLKQTELELNQRLGNGTAIHETSFVPKPQDISELQFIIKELELKIEQRVQEYTAMKMKLKFLLEETEILVTFPERENFIFKDDDAVLSDNKMNELQAVIDNVERYRDSMKIQIDHRIAELMILWDALQISQESRDDFLKTEFKPRASSLAIIDEEFNKCEKQIQERKMEKYF